MKRSLLTLIILFGCYALGISQLSPLCCNGSGSNITANSNGTFTAASAQAYYWEICSGNASISGSNTNQTVSVNCSGSFTIKVTRFSNGSCYEDCEAATCNSGGGGSGSCPSSSDIHYVNEGGGGLCTTGLASLTGLTNVNYVNWTWALGGYSGTVNNAGTTTPIYYPSGNWTNYYIVICATVVLNDGTVCPQVCNSFLLDCGTPRGGGGGLNRAPSVYPNPSEGSFSIDKGSAAEITEVVLRNSQGMVVKSLRSNLNGEIDFSDQEEGIYFIEMKDENGEKTNQVITIKR